jgi:hypothetical protein
MFGGVLELIPEPAYILRSQGDLHRQPDGQPQRKIWTLSIPMSIFLPPQRTLFRQAWDDHRRTPSTDADVPRLKNQAFGAAYLLEAFSSTEFVT